MSIEADLFTILGPLVDNRCYPLTFPLNPPRPMWPAIRYTVVSAVPAIALCGDTGDEGADFRIQLDCVAMSFFDARALRQAVMDAMRVFEPLAVNENSFSNFDPETKAYDEVLEYEIKYSGGIL